MNLPDHELLRFLRVDPATLSRNLPDLMSPSQMASVLSVSPSALEALIQQGQITNVVNAANGVFIPCAAMQKFLRELQSTGSNSTDAATSIITAADETIQAADDDIQALSRERTRQSEELFAAQQELDGLRKEVMELDGALQQAKNRRATAQQSKEAALRDVALIEQRRRAAVLHAEEARASAQHDLAAAQRRAAAAGIAP